MRPTNSREVAMTGSEVAMKAEPKLFSQSTLLSSYKPLPPCYRQLIHMHYSTYCLAFAYTLAEDPVYKSQCAGLSIWLQHLCSASTASLRGAKLGEEDITSLHKKTGS